MCIPNTISEINIPKLLLLYILPLLFFAFFYYIFIRVQLPNQTNETIDEVLRLNNLLELVTGTTGFVKSGEINIWYESIMPPTGKPKGTVLLIMGHSTTALAWSRLFYQPFLDAGYQVIRFDNRGVGMSDWMSNWDKNKLYTLEDMALDTMAVLEALNIKKAHLIGSSMGGMIAQRMAINYPGRFSSLNLLQSSGYMYDAKLPQVPKKFYLKFFSLIIRFLIFPTEKNLIKFDVGASVILAGNKSYGIDIKDAAYRILYDIRKRKGFNTQAIKQHSAAIKASGSRYEELMNLALPTLILHGTSDPLVPIEHSKKCASIIPRAKTIWIEGMGHGFPKHYTNVMANLILDNLE